MLCAPTIPLLPEQEATRWCRLTECLEATHLYLVTVVMVVRCRTKHLRPRSRQAVLWEIRPIWCQEGSNHYPMHSFPLHTHLRLVIYPWNVSHSKSKCIQHTQLTDNCLPYQQALASIKQLWFRCSSELRLASEFFPWALLIVNSHGVTFIKRTRGVIQLHRGVAKAIMTTIKMK